MKNSAKPAVRMRGFSVFGFLSIVVIVGIAAAFTVPIYNSYQVKTRRADAQSFLMEVAARQELHFINNGTYAPSVSGLSIAAPDNVSRHYRISISGTELSPPTFVAKATPSFGSGQSSDITMTIDHTGVKTPAHAW